ncbi:GIY-YIG nuclease family protein [Escherichia coli]
MRKLTHAEQLEAIAKVNPDVEVLGIIINNATKVLCRCKVCGHEWSAKPFHLKRGQGCRKCYDSRRGQSRKLSHEEHLRDIYKVNPNIEVLGKITGDKTKVSCRCKVCGHEWSVIPASLKREHGCPECGRLMAAQRLTLSHKEQVAAIAKVNSNVEILGETKGTKDKVPCRCKICGHEWSPTPASLKSGQGCPKCAKHCFLSHDHGKLYIMVDDPEVPTVMKVGVSVRENERRNEVLKSAHKAGVRLPDLHIVKTWEGPTDYIYEVESMVHDAFSDYRINFPVKFNGSSEFFHYRPDVFYVAQDAWLAIVANAAA